MDWNEHYPNGESPKEFYERVCNTWAKFIKEASSFNQNILLVTHGGVINIIKCIISKTEYSNENKYQGIPSAKIALEIEI